MKTMQIIVLVLLNIVFSTPIQAHSRSVETDTLVLDPDIRYGKLPNGFSYYIKHVPTSYPQVLLRLNVKAGYAQNAADQREIAHFVEHMPFVRTKNFISLLQAPELLRSLKMKHGDISAGTAYNHTTYWFNFPQGNTEAFDKGLLFFHDIASGNVGFRNKDIDGERGPFMEEFVYRNGKDAFSERELSASLSDCSHHPVKPDDFNEYIQKFKPEKLIRFYRDWYRPDRMALTLVGNIEDVDAIESQIRETFSGIKAPPLPINSEDCNVDYITRPNQYVVLEKLEKVKESDAVKMHFYIRDPYTGKGTWKGLRKDLVRQLLMEMLNARFSQATEDYNVPYSISGDFQTHPAALRINITLHKEEMERGVESAFLVLKGIRDYGFNRMEWEKVRQKKLMEISRIDLENPDYWMKELINHYVEGEALPHNKAIGLGKWLASLSLEDFNTMAKAFIKEGPQDIAIITPHAENAQQYTEKTVRDWINKAENTPVAPFIPVTVPTSLINEKKLDSLQARGNVSKHTGIYGTTEIVLDNGVKVVLRQVETPASSNRGKIKIHGFKEGGASCFPTEEYFSAILAPEIVRNAGVGDLDKFQLKQYLAGTSFPNGVRPYIDYNETGITGAARGEDMEKVLLLVYMYFTDPRKDPEAFKDWMEQERRDYLNPSYDISSEDMKEMIRETVGNPTEVPKGTKRFEGAQHTDLNTSYEIYHKLFGQAENFTFLITGAFSTQELLPLVRRYLGNLPSHTKFNNNCAAPTTIPTLNGIEPFNKKIIHKEMMDNTHIKIHFIKKADSIEDWREEVKLDFLSTALNMELNGLRYTKKRGVYFPVAGNRLNRELNQYEVYLSVPCTTEEWDLILNDIRNLLTEIKSTMVGKGIFYNVSRNMYAKYNVSRQESNNAIKEKLYHYYRYGLPLVEAQEVEKFVKSLTREDLLDTAKKYLNDAHKYEFIFKNTDTEN